MIDLKFKIFDKVSIIPLNNETGTVINIWMTNNEIQYKVRYFLKDEPKEVYFYDWELQIIEETKKQIGF